MNIDHTQTPATYLKSKQGQNLDLNKNKNSFKTILMMLGLLIFIGGAISVFLISQKQNTTPVAPTAPQSQPAAYIEKTQTCTLEFEVTEPDIPEKLACGEKNCVSNDDCESGYVCISTSETDDDGNLIKYCADENYLDECVDNPNIENCCEAPVTATPTVTTTPTDSPTITPTDTVTPTTTPTVTPTNTITPTTTSTVTPTSSVTTVITTVGCNESCNANADCSNISHICYNGQCRLDVNPTDAQCKLPSGETTLVRPIEVPTQSGPANWMNYVKAGLGTLGIGALLLLLL